MFNLFEHLVYSEDVTFSKDHLWIKLYDSCFMFDHI